MTQMFTAERVLEYPGGYTRSVGPVIGRFLTGLRDARILGVRLADGRVLVPPAEYDPATSAPIAAEGDHWVEVGPRGTVQAFTWVAEPRAGKHPMTKPFAFALIRPDGADTAMVHVVDCALSRRTRRGKDHRCTRAVVDRRVCGVAGHRPEDR